MEAFIKIVLTALGLLRLTALSVQKTVENVGPGAPWNEVWSCKVLVSIGTVKGNLVLALLAWKLPAEG